MRSRRQMIAGGKRARADLNYIFDAQFVSHARDAHLKSEAGLVREALICGPVVGHDMSCHYNCGTTAA
jgi:hypothetical protein